MHSLKFIGDRDSPLNILCLGAHSDDIEIGCGGTILRLQEQNPRCVVDWAVFSAMEVREAEAQQGAALFTQSACLNNRLLKNFRDGFMPFLGCQIKEVFEELKRTTSPDVIFTHNRNDGHQDHRLISELTWSTFRDHLILEYEIPKYDGDLGRPSLFVPLSSELCQKKVSYIIDTFQSQRCRRWFREDTFFSLLRLRGMECNAASGYAEAFYCRKLVI